MSQIFGDVALALQALEESLQSEEIRNLPWYGASIPTPMRQVLRAIEAGMNAVDREEESVVSMLQHLRLHLEQPNASDLLSHLMSSTFLLVGDKVDDLLGAKSPLTIRRWILQAFVREIDALWANFGQLLLQRLKTFLKGFRWLDKDESGAFGQTEFVRAYMELCMQAGAAESAEGFKNAYENQRADAGFLFKLLAGSSVAVDAEEVGISLYNLVMRIVGVQDQELTTFRRQVYSHYPNVEACFAAHSPKDATSSDLNEQQFLQLGAWLRQFDERFKRRALLTAEDEVVDGDRKHIPMSSELEKKFQRFFKGLDINCSGALSVTEVKQAFAEVAPALPRSSVRRRILLCYGSLHGLMNEVKRSSEDSDSEVEIDTGAAGRVQAEKLSELLELPTGETCNFLDQIEVKESGGKRKVKLPKDGTDYSVEELAISVFLCKALDKDLDDLVSEVHKGDRCKALSFEDFQRYAFRTGHDSGPSKEGKLAKPGKASKPAESKRASVKTFAPVKTLYTLDGGLFPAKYTAEQLRVVYDALEKLHGSVTVNTLLSSFTNISDIMAIDQQRYKGGERIVCRVRLGAETNPLCGKHPVVAVVPSRMMWWTEESGKGYWLMDGQKVKSFAQIGSLPHFLPPGGAGVRDCLVWLTAPWPMTEHRAFDVRVFASDAGRVPLRQVGGQISFSVHMPSPPAPVLEEYGLDPGASNCSALLHWVPPVEEKYCPPILKHILHIEPMLSSSQQILSNGDQSVKDLEVWNQQVRDLEKRKSIQVHDLQRGVPYRFAVQCVHQVESANSEQEVLGAVSAFTETITMPLHPEPSQPGAPEVRAWHQTGKLEVLEILLPIHDVASVDRFCCYDIEYRPEGKEWTRIPSSLMHMNHDPKWDERLNSYCFSCLLIGPKPVIEERDALQFRSRSVNNAGESLWSYPSSNVQLGSVEDQGNDAEQTELQLTGLDVYSASSATLGEKRAESANPSGKSTLSRSQTVSLENPKPTPSKTHLPKSPRTHCRIQWSLEEGEEIHYQVEVREERLPFYASWTTLPAYYRYKKEDKVGEAFVSGLESFPVAEPLILRMLKGSGKRGVCATLLLPGVAGPPAPPQLQLSRTLTAPGSELPVAELMWHEKEPLRDVRSLIEASWELENSLKTEWSPLTTSQPTKMDDGEDGILNICFVQLQLPDAQNAGGEGTRCSLRMRYEGPDGQKGEPSTETDAVQLIDAMRSAQAAQEFLRRSTIKKVKAPKRPQQLTIIGGSKGLWEVSWEQKGKYEKVPKYEAQVCFGTAGLEALDEDWQPVRGLYVQQMEEDEGEAGGLRSVTAAIALPLDYPNDKAWRLRVRIEGGDWSSPTAWQEPGVVDYELPLPGQPSVRSNAFTFALEWEVNGHWTLIQNLQYEVQVQARKRRGSSKFSDWVALTTYYTIANQVADNVTIVKALVERAAASDAVKASFGYEELRFRVRAMSRTGVSAPSEPSETEMLLITQPAAASPPMPPEMLGKGYAVWEDEKSKSLFQSALLHVSFPQPLIDVNELNEGLPPVEYKLEAQFGSQQDESDWKQLDRVLVFADESTNKITALVPTLDEDEEVEEFDFQFAEKESRISFARRLAPIEVRFRLSAERVGSEIFKFDPVHSQPSGTYSQDLPAMPSNLNVFGVADDMLCINFQWNLLARSCKGLLWACLDVQRKQLQNPEEEVPGAGETSEDIDLDVIGGLPVFWVPASELRTLYKHYSSYATADVKDMIPSELVSKACAKTNEASCIGMIPLPKRCRDMTAIRVRLQMSTRNAFGQTNWSQPFVKPVHADEEVEVDAEPAPVCTLHLQYPEWNCIIPGDDEMLDHFSPRVVLMETSGAANREVVLLQKAQHPKTRPAHLIFTVQGVLPKCLRLNSSTGIITWTLSEADKSDDDPMTGIMDSFVIQVALLETWFDEQEGFHAAASLCATAQLHLAAAPTAFGGDDGAWDFLRGILRGFVMEVLQSRGPSAMQAACELLQDEELVEGFADICEMLASDVGLSTYEVLMRVLELPVEYLDLAAEMDPDDFLDLMCLALDTGDDENDSQGQRSGRASEHNDDDGGLGGIEGSSAGSSKENDGLSSSSDDEDVQMPLVLDGEVRVDLTRETNDPKIQVQHVERLSGTAAPAASPTASHASPSSQSPAPGNGERASTMLIGLTKAIAALGARTGDKAQGRRNSLANRSSGTITARRASRAELQQLRRASHLKLEGSNENLEGFTGVSSHKLRSFRRMSSHLGSGTHLGSNTQNGNGDEMTATKSGRNNERKDERKESTEVEISYPSLPPMWPAFEECEFQPSLNISKPKARRRSIMHSATHAGLSARDDVAPQRENLIFSVSPGLPGQICLDETTGTIRGCPLMERVAGCTYTVSASDRTSGEVLGKCTILFAVAPPEVAQLCNAAFRGQDVNSKSDQLSQAKVPAKGYPAKKDEPLPAGEFVSDVAPRLGQPWARVQPPLHSATPGPSSVRPWMNVQQALNASLTKHSSRQGVIQLGPPLKDRDRKRKSTSRGATQLPPVNIATPRN